MSDVMSPGVASELAFANARASLLDTAFRAELAVTEAVATYLGQDAWRIEVLRDEIIGTLSVPQRLKILSKIMDREQWHDDLPFVRPVLMRIFELRNQLAHSMQHNEPQRRGKEWIFPRYSHKGGRGRSFEISLNQLRALVRLAEVVVRIDLHAVWIRSVPEDFWLDQSAVDEALHDTMSAVRTSGDTGGRSVRSQPQQ
jgi:hypothetical protein